MINEEEFIFHKSIVDWLVTNGIPFHNALIVLSYAHKTDKTIPVSYMEILTMKPCDECDICKK